MTLSDLGAQIIKVEIPKKGDDTRAFPPFINNVSSYFMSVNRGKKSITLDLKTREGKEIIYKLVAKSDILLENFRPGVTTRLGVDYETLCSINPRLIYCSISSFGQTGPYAKWPGYDLVIQGMGGLMGITGEQDRPPVRVGMAVTDINAGMYATIAILSALRVRSQTGLGQYLDVSMLDASISLMTYIAGNYFATGKVPDRMGTAHPSIVPYQGFETGDNKFILIAGANDRLFELFCKTIDQEKLLQDPRYKSNDERVKNREILICHLQRVFMKKPRDEWMEAFRKVGFPCAPVYTVDEIFKDPQVLHRNMLVKMDHPEAGKINQIGLPIKFSESNSILTIPPPTLGQHTEEILKFLGYNEVSILELRKKEVIN
jgi:crotonobetainyl-CoA:carnitine CoA-transferase CaiB-like acyl-CoA transferase